MVVRSGSPRWSTLAALCTALTCGGCEDDSDVVATVEALRDGGAPDLGVAGQQAMDMAPPPAGDMCDPDWALYTLARVAIDCEVPADSLATQILATIAGIVLGANRPAEGGEARAPDACDFALPLLYYADDPANPTKYILCPSYCEGLREHIRNHGPPPECL
ncbi:MAG: hypothetical protein OXT09_11715 [Myxococcales bacterium]|nr:hypothetical protein [Myxococcales bacterium]